MVSRVLGLFWLVACALFVTSAIFVRGRAWWSVAIPAVVLSQVLIALRWGDAKWGTLANVMILILALLARADHRLGLNVEREVEDLIRATIGMEEKVVTYDMIDRLPEVVQKWLRASHVVGQPKITNVYVRQTGRLRLEPGGRWMSVKAVQFVRTQHPGFIWNARVRSFPFVWFRGRDKFQDGRGNMVIRLFSFIPVADAGGEEIDQASLVRFLGEMVWYPTAALRSYITWKQIDSTSAIATITYGGISASGIFTFNERGEVVTFTADRYFHHRGEFTLKKWIVDVGQYAKVGGARVPIEAQVSWQFDEGKFTWYNLKIEDLRYNIATLAGFSYL